VAVKLGPYHTSLPHLCRQLIGAGARGLVVSNRVYQPDLDVGAFEVVPNVRLSTSDDLRLPLRWVAILAGRIAASLALSGGVHTSLDAVKAVMAGADAVMMASALLAHGPGTLTSARLGLSDGMAAHDDDSVEQMTASMRRSAASDPAAFERTNAMRALIRYDSVAIIGKEILWLI
jgi:dihydroorotate dehydrogenase (fumarate)